LSVQRLFPAKIEGKNLELTLDARVSIDYKRNSNNQVLKDLFEIKCARKTIFRELVLDE
jgi:hypothetical protein